MHELSVCRALLEQVTAIAAEHGGAHVRSIVVRIGPLSGVEPALLHAAYDVARRETVARRARLDVQDDPVRVRCGDCEREHEASVTRLTCPVCGSGHTRLVSGDALLLESVELERAPSAADAEGDLDV